MPHLQFEITAAPDADAKRDFAGWVARTFAEVMDTGTDHVGVTIRSCARGDLSLGRVTDPEAGIMLLNADIRRGRSFEQRRELAVRIMDEVHRRWAIPKPSMYVIFTEHPGEDFMLHEGSLSSWAAGEDLFGNR